MEELQFIGIGGATCLDLGGNTCFYKEKGKLLIIDVCESATKKLLAVNAFEEVKEIYIAITHTHYDHIAGLGTLIWYCNFYLNIKPVILYSNYRYLCVLRKLLVITGVEKQYYTFMQDCKFNLDGITLKYVRTLHDPKLICHGIMFYDDGGKYYYSGDTKDFKRIKEIVQDSAVNKVYCEVCTESFNMHIAYSDLLSIKNEKIIPMHFNMVELYNRAKQDGFAMPKLIK